MNTRFENATLNNLSQSLRLISGTIKPSALTIYSVVRNEMFFLPAFLHHYRRLGAKQFIFLDDHSEDGSSEFISRQSDCALLHSCHRYGDFLDGLENTPFKRPTRFGVLVKSIIPHRFFPDALGLCADADEFIILPPQMPDLPSICSFMESSGADSIAASLVDFFPESILKMQQDCAAHSPEELFETYPYFDALPLVKTNSSGTPELFDLNGASRRLFTKYGIKKGPKFLDPLPRGFVNKLPLPFAKGGIFKTPIARWRQGTVMVNSHRLNRPLGSEIIIALAHFKFTSDLYRRSHYALQSKSYGRNSLKYSHYTQLLEAMLDEGNGAFLGPNSRMFRSADDFLACGLMRWN